MRSVRLGMLSRRNPRSTANAQAGLGAELPEGDPGFPGAVADWPATKGPLVVLSRPVRVLTLWPLLM